MSEYGKGILGRRDVTGEEINRAMGIAIAKALRRHKEMGVPAATLKDGKVVLIAPEDIVIPEYDPETGEPLETENGH